MSLEFEILRTTYISALTVAWSFLVYFEWKGFIKRLKKWFKKKKDDNDWSGAAALQAMESLAKGGDLA